MSLNAVRIAPDEMFKEFKEILVSHGYTEPNAVVLAQVFTDNSLDGVYTHGVNRFARFVQYVRQGYVDVHAKAECTHRMGGIEQWDGRRAAGILNALEAADRSVELARQHGIGCVALAHTNHWMRGGTYGRRVAEMGLIFLGWTNTIANMQAWGALDPRLGNNPLVMGVPYGNEAVVLDMAMSQYSFGSLELKRMKDESLPVPGGYDDNGTLSIDPAAILKSGRVVPVGYWKGAALSLLLDILAASLSGGMSVRQITAQREEYNLSQVFISIALNRLGNAQAIASMIDEIVADHNQSLVPENSPPVRTPGQNRQKIREENSRLGIPVVREVWEDILKYRL